jgi:hypothetical protein
MGQYWMVYGLVDHFCRDRMFICLLNLGATHGAALARRELEGTATRTILFIGDGGLYASFLSEVRNEC